MPRFGVQYLYYYMESRIASDRRPIPTVYLQAFLQLQRVHIMMRPWLYAFNP